MWISGHCNINGNEEAERHAKCAVTSTEFQKYNQLTFLDIKKNIAMYTYNIWQNHWLKQKTKLNQIKQNIHSWAQIHNSRKIN